MKKSNKLAACVFAGGTYFLGQRRSPDACRPLRTTEQIVTSSVREAWALAANPRRLFRYRASVNRAVRPEARNDFAGYDRSGH